MQVARLPFIYSAYGCQVSISGQRTLLPVLLPPCYPAAVRAIFSLPHDVNVSAQYPDWSQGHPGSMPSSKHLPLSTYVGFRLWFNTPLDYPSASWFSLGHPIHLTPVLYWVQPSIPRYPLLAHLSIRWSAFAAHHGYMLPTLDGCVSVSLTHGLMDLVIRFGVG